MKSKIMKWNLQVGKALLLFGLAGLLVIQSGCGMFRDSLPDYRQEQPPHNPLEIPIELGGARSEALLEIPDIKRDTTLSEEEFEMPRTQPLMTVETKEKVLLRESDSDQWLLVLLPPEEVWTNMLAFFENKEIPMVDVQPLKGIAISDWVVAPKTGETIRFRANLREGIRAGITEIRLYSQLESQDDWVQIFAAVDDQDSMLKGSQVYLIRSIDPSDTSVSFLARNLTAGNRTHIKKAKDGTPLLFIGTGFPRAWSLVGPALNDLNVKIQDRDRSAGRFFLNPEDVLTTDDPSFFTGWFSSTESSGVDKLWLQIETVSGGVEVKLEVHENENVDRDEFNQWAETFLKKLESRLG
ncbi:MAG: outer membrane protein assembly factor BamC [Pseudomonadales bacterium]|nr:outer membrane protein assembly factor BamC [Pseudomonadales bacterium]